MWDVFILNSAKQLQTWSKTQSEFDISLFLKTQRPSIPYSVFRNGLISISDWVFGNVWSCSTLFIMKTSHKSNEIKKKGGRGVHKSGTYVKHMYMYMEISIVATFVNNCDNLHQKYTIYFTRIITTPLSTYIIIVEGFSKHFKDCFGYISRAIVTAFVLLYYWVNLIWKVARDFTVESYIHWRSPTIMTWLERYNSEGPTGTSLTTIQHC